MTMALTAMGVWFCGSLRAECSASTIGRRVPPADQQQFHWGDIPEQRKLDT